jgi:phosphoribosylaminoimidazolecarboxamide formyltransferase/IMP cyclohydrolase
MLANAGVTNIIQPGGSRNDETVIETAKSLNLKMAFTGTRVFKH